MAAALLGRDAERAELGAGRRARAPRHGHAAAPLGRGRRRQDAPRRRGRRRLGRARAARRGELQRRLPLRPCRRRPARVPAPPAPRLPGAAGRSARTSRCCSPSSASRPPAGDRATIFEAIRAALAEIGEPALVVLDDLQWSDEATLELLGGPRADARRAAAGRCCAAYRSDGLPRDHKLRWLRNELRRGSGLHELALAPLDLGETAELLGEPPARARRRRRSPSRSTTARRACRSSSRSSPARSW